MDYKFEDASGNDGTIIQELLVGEIFESIEYLENGASVADNYIYEVDVYNSPSGYVTLKIVTEFPNNPYDGLTVGPLLADGTTEVLGLGFKAIIKDIGSMVSNAKVRVVVGSLTNFGIIPSGTLLDPLAIYVKNTSGRIILQNIIQVVNKPQLENTTGTAILKARPNGLNNPVSAIYDITFVGFTGGTQVCQVSADEGEAAEKIIVADGTTENIDVINGVSMVFEDSGTLSDTDEATVEISDATDFMEIAKDIAGVPDANWGLGPNDLTQIGGAVTGRIDENEKARLWIRYDVDETANSGKNLRQFSLLVVGQVI